tara:strand:+ start:212 stop:541 length:330 start_codon:yes stop_codon:yes gene_type:complete
MVRKDKKKGSAKGRRAALKGFASRAKGMFQSPVHSNGFKQDMLIDMYGGDKGFASGRFEAAATVRAGEALAAGKEYFKHGGTVYKAGTEPFRGSTRNTATPVTRAGKVK